MSHQAPPCFSPLPSFSEHTPNSEKSLDEADFSLHLRKYDFFRGSLACGYVLQASMWCILHPLCQVPRSQIRLEKPLSTRNSQLWNLKNSAFTALHTHTHAHPTPTGWILSPSCPQMKVCEDTAINLNTHHIDFRNHVDAGNVNVHSHCHRGTWKPKGSATWFLRTSCILSKSSPPAWARDSPPQIPPHC